LHALDFHRHSDSEGLKQDFRAKHQKDKKTLAKDKNNFHAATIKFEFQNPTRLAFSPGRSRAWAKW